MKIINLSKESFLALARKEHATIHAEIDLEAMGDLVDDFMARFCCELQLDDKPIGAFGLIPGKAGVASAWAIVTPELRARRGTLMRISQKLVAYAFKHFQLHRLEATVAKDFEAGCDYVEALAKEEGRLHYAFLGDTEVTP